MDTSTSSSPAKAEPETDWIGMALAGVVGATGGVLASEAMGASLGREMTVGGVFGLVCARALRGRAMSAGGGLIWGLGAGFMLWIVLPAAEAAVHLAGYSPSAMLGDARARFPELVACLTCIGAPVGIALGIRGRLRQQVAEVFHWRRAIAVGGLAGVTAALIFSRWMYIGEFYPLISGLGALDSHVRAIALHFAVACLIGCTFGVLFQAEVRNLGSSMGWGMAYAMFWWFLGPMALFPIAAGQRADWSAEHASDLFGPMVGHILFGLILGVVYAAIDAVWTRLFVDSDPLNRKREGPGVRLLLSLGWGAAAGLIGGIAALPLMLRTGMITKLAGLDSGLSAVVGICLYLTVATLIGASYGVLFRGESSNVIFGSLWGLIMGLIWWYAGPMTLLPLMLTGECDWRPETAGTLLPSLVGHLFFGMIAANVFLAFERQHTRWLLSDPRYAALMRRRTGAMSTPATALSVFVLGVGLLLPILLS